MHGLVRKGQQLLSLRKFFIKYCSTSTATISTEQKKDKSSYDDLLRHRQAEATRSIVVQVSSEKSFPELYNFCSEFGNVTGAYHYRVQHDDDRHYILLEFASSAEASAAIDSSAYNEDLTGVPVRSPFLWFRAASGKRQMKSAKKSSASQILRTENGNRILDSAEVNTILQAAPNVDAQIRLLHEHTQLNDIGVRLRFLAALQIETALSGMFPAANAQPFGSSVNGFGKMGCDLDLILRFDREMIGAESKHKRNESRLVFHTKENLTNGRSQVQRQMESIGDMLQLFLPGVCHVRRILQARVPIIKYHHEHLNLEVDLSMSNLTGFYMSELLYMFGEFDDRVRPLIFCIRRWANTCGLTNPSPGRWITNFSLTCLVIFFLQQMKHPVLPTINVLMRSATEDDIRITEDGINCTFGRSFDRIEFHSRNRSAISELLLQFFEYYSQFDFANRAISLNEGRAIPKPDHSALYIVNPLEQVLNVSKNVSLEECERLRCEVRNAAWVLESEVSNPSTVNGDNIEAPWGLLNMFKTPEKAIIRPNMFFRPRMVEVSELFDKTEMSESTPVTASASATATATTADTAACPPPTEYKNSNVRQQVQSIKTQSRNDIRQMRLNVASMGEKISKSRRSR